MFYKSPKNRYTTSLMEKYTSFAITVSKLPHSEVELVGEIPLEHIALFRKKALAHLGEHATLDGFRKGKIPEGILVAKLGEVSILEEIAELAFKEYIPEIFKAYEIRSIGRPEILITKLVPQNPIGFKIKTTVFPEIKIADYKTIGKTIMNKKEEPLEVTEKEIEEVILNLRKSRAATVNGAKTEKTGEKPEEQLPEWNDAFVKTLGDFKDRADFTEKVKENLLEEKKHRAREKKRIEIGNELVKNSTVDTPELLIQSELEKMWSQFEHDINRMGVSFDEYLKHIKKDKETLQKEWRPDAEKNATLELLLAEIAEKEKIVPDEKRVKEEVAHLMEHYSEADPERARIYVETLLTHEAVFDFLEKQK